jgi:tRNA(fMet)-specific endonuclease VapC
MTKSLLLDTNALIALFDNNSDIIDLLTEQDEVFTSVIVLGELYYGAEYSGKREQNIERVRKAEQQFTSLNCDKGTAQVYGQLRKQLRDKGRTIPQNDIWIASTVLQHRLTIVTKDKHFSEVDNLPILSW